MSELKQEFENWAISHGSLSLIPANGGECGNGWFPATYAYSMTEIAWRAFANRRVQPVADQLKLICAGFGWRTDGDSNVLADRIEHHIRDLKAGIKARDTVIAERDAALAATAAPVLMKDHEIAQVVNKLRDIAIEFHSAQQLRERIAHVIVPALTATRSQP